MVGKTEGVGGIFKRGPMKVVVWICKYLLGLVVV